MLAVTWQKRPEAIVRESAPIPTEPIGTEFTAVGTVRWWRFEKGYGAVITEHSAPWDIWCHLTSVEGHATGAATAGVETSGFRSPPSPGQAVEVEYFRFDRDSFKYQARRVRLLP